MGKLILGPSANAIPQWAMAAFGSSRAASSNELIASS